MGSNLTTDPDALSGSGVHAVPESPVVGRAAGDAGGSADVGSGAGGSGAGASGAGASGAGGFGTVVFGVNHDADGLSGSGVGVPESPAPATSPLALSVVGGAAGRAGDSAGDGSCAGASGAGGSGAVVFGVNHDPDGLSESECRGEPRLSSDAFGASGVNSDPDGLSGPVGSLLVASGRYAPEGLSGGRASGTRGSPTRPPSVTPRDSVSPAVCASSASGPGRMLCAPICTTSLPPASLGTTGGDRSADPVKKQAQYADRGRGHECFQI